MAGKYGISQGPVKGKEAEWTGINRQGNTVRSINDRPFYPHIQNVSVLNPKKGHGEPSRIVIPNPDFRSGNSRNWKDDDNWKPMSDTDYTQMLSKRGLLGDSSSSSDNTGNKPNLSNVATNSNVSTSGAVSTGATQSNTKADSTPTPIMIYAKKCYGIEYADFTDAKFNKKAKIDLGIDDKSNLIKDDERKKNFELFKKNHFTNIDNVQSYSGNEPESGMKAYDEIKKYALSSYGSLMIKKVLTKPETPKFLIGVSESHGAKASGEYKRNFIVLPASFPSSKKFDISKQKILGVAIIHHEFEHTKHGQYKLPKSIEEEYKAVRFKENPVRILNGYEPRYVYYDFYTKHSINIITKEKQPGKWTYDKIDPSKPMVEIQ